MPHFTTGFPAFFRGLARNNKREWYHAHKADFDEHVKGPFSDFVAELIEKIAALDPHLRCEPPDAIFRLARDIRFSRDKTPYKTFTSAVIAPGGRKARLPGLYLQLGVNGLALAGGAYQPSPADLTKIRRAIVKRGAALEKLLADRTFKRIYGTLQGERNVRLPPDFAPRAERFPLLYHKQFYYWREYTDPKIALRRDLLRFVMRHYEAGRPVNAWLTKAMSAR
jgi:uncharacterized protein (TIGR02453 family)